MLHNLFIGMFYGMTFGIILATIYGIYELTTNLIIKKQLKNFKKRCKED